MYLYYWFYQIINLKLYEEKKCNDKLKDQDQISL